MKKLNLLLVCFSMLLGIASCDNNTNNSSTSVSNDQISESESPQVSESSSEKQDSSESSDSSEDKTPEEDKENQELYVCIPEGRDLRVAQFADIHFGIEGKDWHNDKVDRTKKYMQSIVDEQKPDLIVCSGDNILSTGVDGLTSFVELMESYKIPWTWAYGNHDAESTATKYKKADLSKKLMSLDTEYLLYKEGYIESGKENRYGNFSISIYNSTKENLLGAFIVMDSGEHDYSIAQYQHITSGQIEWYEQEIDELQARYTKQENNKYDVIPTIVFSHIQLPEFYDAYVSAKQGTGAEFVISQELSDSGINEIKSGGPAVNSGFFDVLVEKQSTKAYFVGHAHTFNFQVKYQGIILGFGPQTGFSKLFAQNNEPRKTYIYEIAEDLTFETVCVNEVVKNKGLIYAATNGDGNAAYDQESNLYVFTTTLGLWNRVTIDFYGTEYTEEFVRLNPTNTTFKGCYNSEYTADWTTNLYFSSEEGTELLCSCSDTHIYKFIYSPDENLMTIEIVENPIIKEGDIAAVAVNKNSTLTVWKNKGFAVKTETAWCSTYAQLFIVVDSEGRICYSSAFTGYGEPSSDNYYVHPYYETDRDYTTNPAFKFTDKGYRIVVPEGGFAISVYGESLPLLVRMVLDPTYDKNTKISTLVNHRNAYNEDLRISYNPDTKIISTSYDI